MSSFPSEDEYEDFLDKQRQRMSGSDEISDTAQHLADLINATDPDYWQSGGESLAHDLDALISRGDSSVSSFPDYEDLTPGEWSRISSQFADVDEW